MKKAICIGINNCPGIFNDLKGCVNDAKDWSALLQGYGFDVNMILDVYTGLEGGGEEIISIHTSSQLSQMWQQIFL